MILISHRGNINGKNSEKENSPAYIDDAIKQGYDVEIDLWSFDNKLFLGHDKPQYEIQYRWIRDRVTSLWIHCKNIDAVVTIRDFQYDMNYFFHNTDEITLTNKNYLWTYPGKKLTKYSIAVMPEKTNYTYEELSNCYGICSDYIEKYKLLIKK
jgi:hypothetical protein